MENKSDSFKSQQKIGLLSIISETPNLIIQIILLITTGSLIVAIDTLDTICSFIQSVIVFFVSKNIQKTDYFAYNYGKGKFEALGTLTSSILLYLGAFLILFSGFLSLSDVATFDKTLLVAIAFKVLTITIDIFLLNKQIKTVKGIKGSFTDSNTLYLKKNLIFDLIAFLCIILTYIFRGYEYIKYIELFLSIFIVIYILNQTLNPLKSSINNLLDKTLSEDKQFIILSCISKISSKVKHIHNINSRLSGQTIIIDIVVSFEDDTTYDQIFDTYSTLCTLIKEEIDNVEISFVINK